MDTVTLRPLTVADAARLADLANNPNVSINLRDGFPNPYTLADAERFISMCLKHEPAQVLAIEYNGEYVGNIGLHPGTDVYRKSAEIGYFIGEPYWSKGIMTRAVKLMIDYGFSHLDIVRIHTGVFEYNTASQKVLEKCGFKREGIFEKSVYKNKRLWDEVRYALVKLEDIESVDS
jgi:RimJ/RimL family protein N-acetyltransferase